MIAFAPPSLLTSSNFLYFLTISLIHPPSLASKLFSPTCSHLFSRCFWQGIGESSAWA